MSNYSQTTDFSAKDSLASGNASKVIKGSDVDTEFNAIATAIATKRDSTSTDIPSGTMMLFVRTAAPSGWTLSTTWNNVVPIIKSSVTNDGTPDTAGNWEINTAELTMTLPVTTINLPAHTHAVGNLAAANYAYNQTSGTGSARYAPADAAHTHSISGSTANQSTATTSVTSTAVVPTSGTMYSGNWRPAHVEVIACSKD
jgi:hypothetical protein